jgi:hypothetical protein
VGSIEFCVFIGLAVLQRHIIISPIPSCHSCKRQCANVCCSGLRVLSQCNLRLMWTSTTRLHYEFCGLWVLLPSQISSSRKIKIRKELKYFISAHKDKILTLYGKHFLGLKVHFFLFWF